jgi:predicted transposase/invertase (TIGR01784 family)
VTNLDKWLYLLKNLSQMKDISPVFQQPVFEKLFNIAEYTNLTKEEKMDYDSSQKYRWDNQNALEYASKEGREIGIEQGIEIGKKEDKLEIALEMKKENFPVEQIARFTKLAVEEIESLPVS